MLYNQLTDKEKEMIDNYIESYGPHERDQSTPYNADRAALHYVLRHWDREKRDLYKLLGDNIVIEKDVHLDNDVYSIRKALSDMMESTKVLHGRSYEDIFHHFHKWLFTACRACWDHYAYMRQKGTIQEYFEKEKPVHFCDTDWFNLDSLAKNEYTGYSCITFFPDSDKPYQIKSGMRLTKLIGRLQKAFGGDMFSEHDFAEFCDLLAMARSTASSDLRLGLSIHPLDYMTMSDNDMNWTSCMSWKDHSGDYRQGTVECMNSPTVLIAYVRDKHDMWLNDVERWTNKAWRQLFIVSPDAVVAVKGYPFQHDNVVDKTLEWIKELAKENWNMTYDVEGYVTDNSGSIFFDEDNTYNINNSPVSLHVNWGYMYDDIGTLRKHKVLVNSTYISENIGNYCYRGQYPCIELIGSGRNECMWCGEDIDNNSYDDDTISSYVICTDCASDGKNCSCDYCNNRFYSDELNYFPNLDMYLCEDCESEHIVTDDLTGECFLDEDMKNIHLAFGVDPKTNQPVITDDIYITINRNKDYTGTLEEYFKPDTTAQRTTVCLGYRDWQGNITCGSYHTDNVVYPQDLTKAGFDLMFHTDHIYRNYYDIYRTKAYDEVLEELCKTYNCMPVTEEYYVDVDPNFGYRFAGDEEQVVMDLDENHFSRHPRPRYYF